MPVRMGHHAAARTSPPTTQVAATEGGMREGQGTAGRLEAGTMLRSSLSSKHVTCAEMLLGH